MTVQPAFYGRTGTVLGDLVTILHLPYTLWHLSYVVIGAALAPHVDALRLTGTVVAFAAGLGIGAHALDEVHDRPLGTSLSDRTLWVLGAGGLAVAAAVAVVGSLVISPWVLVWAAAGTVLALAYSLEWTPLIHSDPGFALAWGAFPVVVGYWAQTGTVTLAAMAMAGVAAALSAAQRSLSKSATRLRRSGMPVDNITDLSRWEDPLRYLAVAMPLLALALLTTHL
ncbi:MAG TPA: hypothetical protein VJ938_10570 [Acidimicrobiia bacterium]|nr:hypothetical protein [Acidimicrobiia bacterium]